MMRTRSQQSVVGETSNQDTGITAMNGVDDNVLVLSEPQNNVTSCMQDGQLPNDASPNKNSVSSGVQDKGASPITSTTMEFTTNMMRMMESMMSSMAKMQQNVSNQVPLTSNFASTNESSAVTYCLMPDLSSSIEDYDGEGDAGRAQSWLESLLRTASNHRWPDAFKLETAKLHLARGAREWYLGRQYRISTWADFEAEFRTSFAKERSLPERWQRMTARMQGNGESATEYVYSKMRLCRDLDLSFAEAQEQILIGLRSRTRCSELICQLFDNDDALLEAIHRCERVDKNRAERAASTRTIANHEVKTMGPPKADAKVAIHQSAQSRITERRCYNCNQYSHLARDCPEPRRPMRCRSCNQEGHLQRNCPSNPQMNRTKPGALLISTPATDAGKYMKSVYINGQEFQGLIDTGSSSCVVRSTVALQAGLRMQPNSYAIYGFGDTTSEAAKTLGTAMADIVVDGVRGHVEILIVPDKVQPVEVIIGRSWTEQPHVTYMKIGDKLEIRDTTELPFQYADIEKLTHIDLRATQETTIPARTVNLVEIDIPQPRVFGSNGKTLFTSETRRAEVPVANFTNHTITVEEGQVITRAEEVLTCQTNDTQQKDENELPGIQIDKSVSSSEREQLVKLLRQYRDCFATNMKELGCTSITEMTIEETDNSKPVRCKPYRTTKADREIIANTVKQWKEYGIATNTKSAYASPVLVVWKKNGEPRVVVDYRRLNAQTKKQPWPIPDIDELLEQLSEASVFTVLDLAHGYFQIPLNAEAKEKTAFVTPDETGQFERMSFGLVNAPYEFTRLMHHALGDLRNHIALCYMDDLMIPAKDWDDMLYRIERVFEALRHAGLTLKPSKCEFGRREVGFLGFRVSADGIRPGERKILAIKDFIAPKNVHEVRRFLGLIGFFRRFIPRCAERAKPLSQLTGKDAKFSWKDEQQNAFEDLKMALLSDPVLRLHNPRATTELHTDASAEGLAGMLIQLDEHGKSHLVYCVSKKLTLTERVYHSSKLELMAIVWCMERLRQFLIAIQFTVVTDCQALVFMNQKKTTNPQIARWMMLVQEFDFEIRHRPGVRMTHVDALSRASVETASDTISEILQRVEVCLTLTVEDQILLMQRGDVELREKLRILSKLEKDRSNEEINHVQGLELRANLLYKRLGNRLLFVVPKPMRKAIVVKCHDLMGHFALDKTVAKIQELYWFSGMRRYVKQHIGACFDCLITKTPGGKRPGKLNPIPPGQRPFDVIHMDHVGPFVRSRRRNSQLLVIVDNLTKYIHLYPMASTSTKDVLRAFSDFNLKRGLPNRVVTDRGTCFTSREFETFCTTRGIRHTLNSTQHPQANGQVERANRTLLPRIMIGIKDPDHRDWDAQLDEIARDINCTMNKSTGRTPFETLHGYQPRFHDGLERFTAVADHEWTRAEIIQDEVKRNILNEQTKMKEAFDKKHHQAPTYESGELVMMRRVPEYTGQPNKTQIRFRGPLVIIDKLPADTYRVADLQGKEGRRYASTAHASQLKAWRCPRVFDDDPDELSGSTDEDNEPPSEHTAATTPYIRGVTHDVSDTRPDREERPNDLPRLPDPVAAIDSQDLNEVVPAFDQAERSGRPVRNRRRPQFYVASIATDQGRSDTRMAEC